ncbi:LysR family transcriptional regulator [Bordetella genomosp. 9]|uniref:LysR family transcriptional regulator n=1 Tax=Bordetella genomosp. 9 TaxID=1416803 RepID=A0A261RNN4_9BORD|nr:LysR family transcriptional regulator [Bordetella genomosp. 9]OZI26387.1 LysR family transcriptional regulator [Bordetella genomosp. 9]
MQDLNDLYYFSQVIEYGGFSAAARALNVPKSRLSRRIAELEANLGVRLLQRSTRRLRLSAAGERYLQYCREISAAARAANDAMLHMKAAPSGPVRVSCPVAIAQGMVAPILPEFLDAWPDIRVELLVTNRRIDLIAEGVDLAIRVRERLNTDADFVVRHLGQASGCLVASPGYLQRWGQPADVQDLAEHAALHFAAPGEAPRWTLLDEHDVQVDVPIRPVLVCNDFTVLVEAALKGRGIALLPVTATHEERRQGRLVHVLPEWRSQTGILHCIYPSRHGMTPAVRAMLDFLTERLKTSFQQQSLDLA